ncbi:MAG: serine hydrolase [Phormidium sp.]
MSNPPPRYRSTQNSWSRRQWRRRLQEGQGTPRPRVGTSKVTPLSSRRRQRRDTRLDLPSTSRRQRMTRDSRLVATPLPFPSQQRFPRSPQGIVAPQIPLPPPSSSRSRKSGTKTSPPRPRRRRRRLPVPAPLLPMLYGARLAIAGIGLSAVAGTLMALWTPVEGERLSEGESQEMVTAATPGSLRQSLGRELTGLDDQLQELLGAYPELTPGVMVLDVATGDYVQIGQDRAFAAASTIKSPILVAFFQAVDGGQVRLDEPLRLQESHIQGGSGSLQYEAPGLELSALEVATLMIVESDNTATNLLIDRLGGMEALNDRFRQWGMTETVLQDWLPDLQGTNTTTPRELAGLLAQIERGELLSMASRDRLLRIMMLTENDTLLPQGLGTGAVIAHKTGNLRGVLGDAGLVDVVNGRRYVVVALVERPEYDEEAVTLIRELSARVYGYFAP